MGWGMREAWRVDEGGMHEGGWVDEGGEGGLREG